MKPRRRPTFHPEAGFTLPELLVTVLIMGILAAIAIPSWSGLMQSRNVDSATNQVVADSRLASSRAANRLVSRAVILTDNGATYQVGPVTTPATTPTTRSLPDGTQTVTGTASPVTVTFAPDGSATLSPASLCSGGVCSFKVSSTSSLSRFHTVQINTATSEIKVVF